MGCRMFGNSSFRTLTRIILPPTAPAFPNGYKDPDGDGWTNLDEMRNGTDPLVFNTPAPPKNVVAHFTSGETNATVTWEPASGPVIGYVISDYGYVLGTVDSNTFSFTDPYMGIALGDANWPQAEYEVQAIYSQGLSELSADVDIWKPELTISAALVRGPNAKPYLLVSALQDDVSAIQFTWFTGAPTFLSTNISIWRSNFASGVFAIPDGTLPTNIGFWAQGVSATGDRGKPIYPGSIAGGSFTDMRQVLSDNLRFYLRGATRTQPFTYAAYQNDNDYYPLLSRDAVSDAYDYSGFHWFYEDPFDPEYSHTDFEPRRTLRENFFCRNFAYDASLLTTLGFPLTGAHPRLWYYAGSRSISNALFSYNGISFASQLSDSQIGGIFYTILLGITNAGTDALLAEVGMTEYYDNGIYWTLSSGATNLFGLPIDSINLVRGNYGLAAYFYELTASQSAEVSSSPVQIYANVQQPTFENVSYYFSTPSRNPDEYVYSPPIPGEPDFSPTNVTPLLIAGMAQPYSISGWAKKIITNGDTNKSAYLEQFFDKAYKADSSGNATTNETGVLSEYGEFFPTEPGRIVLTTKPDIETAEVGSNLLYVIHIGVDANHDGVLDRTFAGPDVTSEQRPFRFWINNDSDAGAADQNTRQPNCADNIINGERDLEDFARFWISGVPTLPSGYNATLTWSGDGAIKIYDAYEADGGMAYLTNTDVAYSQSFSSMNGSGVWTGYGAAIATVSANSSWEFPANTFSNGFRRHFIFEGVLTGKGQLIFSIQRGDQMIAQSSVFMQLQDIKEMYEQAHAENASLAPPYLVGTNGPPSSCRIRQALTPAPDETKQVIVFVHGANNSQFDYETTSATFFKRLYWSGYRGRFASFRWQSLHLPDCALEIPWGLYNFNPSEFIAWQSAHALRDYLLALENRPGLEEYTLNIVAHSQGNVVASEALIEGAPFDNYILSQGAVPAHAYDPNVPFLQKFLSAEQSVPTPYSAASGGYHDYFSPINGNLVNFYNTNDFALVSGTCSVFDTNWEKNHESHKPEQNYRFDGTNCWWANPDLTNQIVNPMVKKAMIARTRSHAVGAQNGMVGVIATSVDLQAAPFAFGQDRAEHSGQLTRNVQSAWHYYDEVLDSFRIPQRIAR